jgi:serine/threonine protein kinase
MELKAATHGFSKKHLVGEGSFGSVYKGVLKDGRTIAIKRFRNCTPEGDADFLNEVDIISKVKHRNLVVLRGCCVDSNHAEGHQRMLVYDFMVNGSLADCLFDKSKPVLGWSDRRKIGIGMARGLAYLHAEVVPQIIHRDVKASNILLDEQFNARVADFGLAKLAPENEVHFTTHVAGTHGYVAPEYALYGQLTESSDVYSFGVCLLELISGRTALTATSDKQHVCLITDWAWLLLKEGKGIEVVDQAIRNMGSQEVMLRFVKVGILCAHLLVAFRPSMMDALKMLEGDCDIPEIPDRPLPLMMPNTLDLESFCLS